MMIPSRQSLGPVMAGHVLTNVQQRESVRPFVSVFSFFFFSCWHCFENFDFWRGIFFKGEIPLSLFGFPVDFGFRALRHWSN